MAEPSDKQYVVVVQCHLVKQRCSGFFCEKSFHERTGGFASYPKNKPLRSLYMTCGGCCGLAVHRKLTQLVSQLKKNEEMEKSRIAVQLASCVTRDNYHGPPCPHLDYIKTLISRLGLDFYEDTRISDLSQRRRADGVYRE
jgi:predicted metal-binding protein